MIEYLAARIATLRAEIAIEEDCGGGDPVALAALNGALGEAEALRDAVLDGKIR